MNYMNISGEVKKAMSYQVKTQTLESSLLFLYNLRKTCLLYTSDAADERSSVDLGGRRIIKKKKNVDIKLRWMSI